MFLACLFSKEQWRVRMGNLCEQNHQDGLDTGVVTLKGGSASGWQSYWCEHNHQDGIVTITNVVILKGTINLRTAKLLVWAQPPGWHWHWCGYLERNDFHQDGKVTGVSRTTRMALTLVWLPWRGRSASGWQSYWCDYTDTPHRPRRCRLHFQNLPPHNRRSTTSWSK